MDNQNYVLDMKRDQAWANPSDAVRWYQAELDRIESLMGEAWNAGYEFRAQNHPARDASAAKSEFLRRLQARD